MSKSEYLRQDCRADVLNLGGKWADAAKLWGWNSKQERAAWGDWVDALGRFEAAVRADERAKITKDLTMSDWSRRTG